MAKKSKAAVASGSGASSPQGSVEDGREKEGSLLLGQPTWEDAGGGRWQCAETGHELPEREKDAVPCGRACRLALIDNGVAHKKPPLNAFKPYPEHKSKFVCNITRDTINKSEEYIWKHVNGKRFLNKLEKLEEKLAAGESETAEVQGEQSNEVTKKSKSSKKKDKKKAAVVNPSLPREPEPEIDDSDDPEFWEPPVGNRWDDDDGKDRWESSPGKDGDCVAEDESASDDEEYDNMADKDDEVSEELASSRTKRLSVEAVGPSSFATRKKKARKDQ